MVAKILFVLVFLIFSTSAIKIHEENLSHLYEQAGINHYNNKLSPNHQVSHAGSQHEHEQQKPPLTDDHKQKNGNMQHNQYGSRNHSSYPSGSHHNTTTPYRNYSTPSYSNTSSYGNTSSYHGSNQTYGNASYYGNNQTYANTSSYPGTANYSNTTYGSSSQYPYSNDQYYYRRRNFGDMNDFFKGNLWVFMILLLLVAMMK